MFGGSLLFLLVALYRFWDRPVSVKLAIVVLFLVPTILWEFVVPYALQAEYGHGEERRPAPSSSRRVEYDPDRPLPTPPRVNLDGSLAAPAVDPLYLAGGVGALVFVVGAGVAFRTWRAAEAAEDAGRSRPRT